MVVLLLSLGLLLGSDWVTITKTAIQQVVRIEIQKDGDEDKGVCSGIVINKDDGYVLSAAHCFPGDDKLLAITSNGRKAKVVEVDRINDLAVLKTKFRDELQIVLADKVPPAGSDVSVVGYPFGVKEAASQFGKISQPLNKETETIWLDASIVFGNSGGSCIDADGKLIGVTSRIYYNGPAKVGAAIAIEAVRDFVEDFLPKPKK